jgi:tRNA dimethylallyltransferase
LPTNNQKYSSETRPVIIIGGPTASGKSATALEIAEKHNGVIINADSIQLYKDLPLLTAHPDAAELSAAPHKLYGFMPADQKTDAQEWRNMAIKECHAAHENGQCPILVGGTGFYLKTMIEGLSPVPSSPADIREKVTAHMNEVGVEAFSKELVEKDPKIVGKVDLNNPMRLMRAAEVLEATGKSIVDWQSLPKSGAPKGLKFYSIFIIPERARLHDRCNRRFHMMIEEGAIDQVKDFNERTGAWRNPQNFPVTRAIGYTHISDYLSGTVAIDDAIEKSQAETRQYAKRQITWFNNQIKPNAYIENPKDGIPADLSDFLET